MKAICRGRVKSSRVPYLNCNDHFTRVQYSRASSMRSSIGSEV